MDPILGELTDLLEPHGNGALTCPRDVPGGRTRILCLQELDQLGLGPSQEVDHQPGAESSRRLDPFDLQEVDPLNEGGLAEILWRNRPMVLIPEPGQCTEIVSKDVTAQTQDGPSRTRGKVCPNPTGRRFPAKRVGGRVRGQTVPPRLQGDLRGSQRNHAYIWANRAAGPISEVPHGGTPSRRSGAPPATAKRTTGSCRHSERRRLSRLTILTVNEAPDYAFPHSSEDESRRLELLEHRLDPLTKRRIGGLEVSEGSRCLEIGGGRGSITRWLSGVVGPTGRVIATDLQMGFLSRIDASNVEVLRHDIRTETFPPDSFDLIHTRAVLMHISPSVELLQRIVTWLAPGGWLLLEEPDFGMWIGDADPVWATSPQTTQVAFPNMALSQGRSLLRQIHQLGLTHVGADAEIDIIQAGTELAEFYKLSQAALAGPKVQVGALSPAQAAALTDRPGDDNFLACGFVHIGVWGRRPPNEKKRARDSEE